MDNIWDGFEEYYEQYIDWAEMPGYCHVNHTWDELEKAKFRLERSHYNEPWDKDSILNTMLYIKQLPED